MKHKHHNEIIAWANGAKIEYRTSPVCEWAPCYRNDPAWADDVEYRVALTPKPDIWQWACFYLDVNNDLNNATNSCTANIKLTFDGETGKLKAAEVIDND